MVAILSRPVDADAVYDQSGWSWIQMKHMGDFETRFEMLIQNSAKFERLYSEDMSEMYLSHGTVGYNPNFISKRLIRPVEDFKRILPKHVKRLVNRKDANMDRHIMFIDRLGALHYYKVNQRLVVSAMYLNPEHTENNYRNLDALFNMVEQAPANRRWGDSAKLVSGLKRIFNLTF